jgi:hypothetical protein
MSNIKFIKRFKDLKKYINFKFNKLKDKNYYLFSFISIYQKYFLYSSRIFIYLILLYEIYFLEIIINCNFF